MREDLGVVSACYSITFERTSKHSPARLWRAITDPAEVSVWMEGPATIDLRVGGKWFVDFSGTDEGELDGVIFRVQPERVLGCVWGTSVVQWTIEPDGDGCRYTFLQSGLAGGRPDEAGLPAGWHGFLDQLEAKLDDRPVDKSEAKQQWEALKPHYNAQLEAVFGSG